MEYIYDEGEGVETVIPDKPVGPLVLSQGDRVTAPDGAFDHRPGFTRADGSTPPPVGQPVDPPAVDPVVTDPPPADPPVNPEPPVVPVLPPIPVEVPTPPLEPEHTDPPVEPTEPTA